MNAKYIRTASILCALSAGAFAADTSPMTMGGGQGMGRGPHGGPPPEALDACKGKTSGATCAFNNRRNEKMNGTCFAPPAGQPGATAKLPLACRPDQAGMGPGGGQDLGRGGN